MNMTAFNKYLKEQADARKKENPNYNTSDAEQMKKFNPKYFGESFMKAYKEEKDK